jgi:hypothetical protein
MKLAELRKEDEIKAKSTSSVAKAFIMTSAPPKAASLDALPPAQAFISPMPQSTSQWGSKIKVVFRDVSGIQGENGRPGWIFLVREGHDLDRAVSDVSASL